MSITPYSGRPGAGMTTSDDLILWPDGVWCHRHELADFSHKSDDYEVISALTPEYDTFFRTLGRPQAGDSADRPTPVHQRHGESLAAPAATGQGADTPNCHCDECGWSGTDDVFLTRCPMCNISALVIL